MSAWQVFSILVVAYLPGALIFRLPVAERPRRAALPVEERVFWSVLLSLAVSSVVVLSLAAGGWYRFDRLLWFNGTLGFTILVLGRGRLFFSGKAPRLTWTAIPPIALVTLGWWMNFNVPPSEYIMGGKDPGVYMNEGVQIAQRGGLAIPDTTVASVPPTFRDLFFPYRGARTHYSTRFMGFFLLDPESGSVISQFTHLYPSWIAIAYGIHGLNGARWILGLWGILGVLAVYFLGVRLAGRAAAAAGAGLLAVHVLQVWYARYPNAELVMQPLVFAGLLAYARAQVDHDRFFAPLAGVLLALTVFAHLTGVFVLGAVAAAIVLGRFAGQRPPAALILPLLAGAGLATIYLITFLSPYFVMPVEFVERLSLLQQLLLAALVFCGVVLWWGAERPWLRDRVRASVPIGLVAALCLGAVYAYFFRFSEGRLAPHDADALRTFAWFYLTPLGLCAALAGFAILARQSFWTSAPMLLVVALFSCFFFYKIRIIPEHFWAARRFLAVILPGSLLLVGTAAFASIRFDQGGRYAWASGRVASGIRYTLGFILVVLLGRHFLGATQPVLRHVEYAGLIPRLEKLAATFGDNDLVVIEARAASDVHVLALPLAYVYARHVLVLSEPGPDKNMFREFLAWARSRYARVFFVGGGGTELLSRTMGVKAIGGERFQIPEYESTWNSYPRGSRFKEFDFGIYEFLPNVAEADGFDLDVGVADDLYVRRFHAKERRPSGATFRWTRDTSYVSIVGTRPDCRRLTVWMGSGDRPPEAGEARVEVFLNDAPLGAATTGAGFESYRFEIPAELADAIARDEDAARLRLVSATWNPRRLIGGGDDRDLGVMVERIGVECVPPEEP
jgi:hypothetical protein